MEKIKISNLSKKDLIHCMEVSTVTGLCAAARAVLEKSNYRTVKELLRLVIEDSSTDDMAFYIKQEYIFFFLNRLNKQNHIYTKDFSDIINTFILKHKPDYNLDDDSVLGNLSTFFRVLPTKKADKVMRQFLKTRIEFCAPIKKEL